MDVVPVVDLMGGQVVHARMGRRDSYRPIETPLCRGSAPEDVVAGLMRVAAFRRLYVADLDAIEGRGDHDAVLRRLALAWPGLEVWVDRGVADADAARRWLGANGGSLVLGSESLRDAGALRSMRGEARFVLSLDFRGEAFQGPASVLERDADWPDRVVVMTLARVGAEAGPDLRRVAELAARAGSRQVFAAGGVRDAADLAALGAAGAAGALVATALHDGRLDGAAIGEVWDGSGSAQARRPGLADGGLLRPEDEG